MENLAYKNEVPGTDNDVRFEKINGIPVAMSPASMNHLRISFNISRIFSDFLYGKPCEAFGDNAEVHLNEKDRFIPDCIVVCNRDIIKPDGVYGAPDLVVEILSPSTARRDKIYKKNAYEKAGVKEYWLVDQKNRSIDVYILRDGAFVLDNVYSLYPDYELEKMSEDEKDAIVTEFKCSLFDELTISLEEVFRELLFD